MAEWKWTQPRQLAAQLLAEGKPLAEISKVVKVSPATLTRWSQLPECKARIAEIRAETAEGLKRAGLRVKENRLDHLNTLVDRIYLVIEGRAADMAEVPGGKSGLLLRKRKSIGWGENTEKVEEYAFDRALVEELREILKHAAQETGEWIDRKEMSGPEGKAIPIDISSMIAKVYGEKGEETSG